MLTRKRIGRPLKDHPPGEELKVSVVMPSELKAKLQERAKAAGRSLSKEIVLTCQREANESPSQACNRMFGGGEAGWCSAWIGQTGMFLRLTAGSTTKLTVYKEHIERVRALLKQIEAKATVVSGKGGDNE